MTVPHGSEADQAELHTAAEANLLLAPPRTGKSGKTRVLAAPAAAEASSRAVLEMRRT